MRRKRRWRCFVDGDGDVKAEASFKFTPLGVKDEPRSGSVDHLTSDLQASAFTSDNVAK